MSAKLKEISVPTSVFFDVRSNIFAVLIKNSLIRGLGPSNL